MNAYPRYYTVLVLSLAAGLLAPPQAEAAKEKFVRSKPHVNIGTIGHSSTSETATAFLRAGAPPAAAPSAPPCDGIEGEVVVYEPGETDPAQAAGRGAIRVLTEAARYPVALSGAGELFSLDLGAGSGLGGIRHLSVVDFRFDDPDAPRRCGLEASVQVYDSLTGETRAVYFGSYRPQFYFRTPD